MAALVTLATLCLISAVSLAAALSRRLPRKATPIVFPVPAFAGVLLLAARDTVAGRGFAAAAIICSVAALGVAMSMPDAQLSPWWFRRFERDLALATADFRRHR